MPCKAARHVTPHCFVCLTSRVLLLSCPFFPPAADELRAAIMTYFDALPTEAKLALSKKDVRRAAAAAAGKDPCSAWRPLLISCLLPSASLAFQIE